MRLPKNVTLDLFSSVIFVVLLLLLVSLPGLASPSFESSSEKIFSSTVTKNFLLTERAGITSIRKDITISITQTIILTDTETPTPSITPSPTFTPSPTDTPTPTLFPTATNTPIPTQFAYLPYLYRDHFIPTYTPTPTPPPPESVLFCAALNQPISIPDDFANGINSDLSITENRVLVGVRLYLDISHTWVGDLVVNLSHLNNAQAVTAINRPGPAPYGCGNDDIVAILDSGAARPADQVCAAYPHAISGIFQPDENLSIFTGQSVSGTWRLNVSDRYINDTGELNHWCLETQLADVMPAPTPPPTPVNLPSSASVGGMSGQDQHLKLDCESRSAVDWANHFGKSIDEFDFLNHLPRSDDPEVGFVGDPNGIWGNIPPNDYGVHAPPVANLLNSYGLIATSSKSLTWDDLRSEIASGRPVIVWIIGDAFRNLVNGTPHFYTATSTGNTSIVSPFEHTVILTGYSPTSATVLNGARSMEINLNQFLDSWSALDFMGVLANP